MEAFKRTYKSGVHSMDLPPIEYDTPLEKLVMQQEERLLSLEADRPVHESLGNYQHVSEALWKRCDELGQYIVSPSDYVCMYLNLFQKLPQDVRIEQAWEVTQLCRNERLADVAHYIFHALRCHGQREVINHWRQHAPFTKQQMPPTFGGMSSGGVGSVQLGGMYDGTITLPIPLGLGQMGED